MINYPVTQPAKRLPPFDFPQGFAGGYNISVPPDLVASNESPDMINMNYNVGSKPTKRFGFARMSDSWGDTGIKGMAEYTPPGGTLKRIIAWGGKLWVLNDDGTKTDLMTGAKASIADTQCWFFVVGDKLYCMTGTDYVVYDGTHAVADVVGYIPTVVIGKAPDGTGGATDKELNLLSNSWIEGFTGDGTSTEYILTIAADSATATVNGTPTAVTFPTGGDYKKVTFASPVANDAIVEIKATKAGLNDATVVSKCTTGVIYGGRNDTRVFLCGNPDYPNQRVYSGLLDPTYFPINNYDLLGSDAEELTGFGKLVDYLIHFKYDSLYYSTIEVDSTGKVMFPNYPMNDEYGCVSARTIKPAQGGLLALSKQGVIWVTPSFVRGQLNARVVSEKINGLARNGVDSGILDEDIADLEGAYACLDHGKYRLSIKNKTWILDLNYSDLANGIYCWYPYDGVYANAGQFLVSEQNESVYIGHKTLGVIYKQNRNSYSDDGTAIDAWWTSPLIFGGRRDWVKKFMRLNITFKGQPEGNHQLTIFTDKDKKDLDALVETAGSFDYSSIDYAVFNYGVPFFPSSQTKKIKEKGEYMQWRIRNSNLNEGLTILGQSLQYMFIKRVK